MIKRHNCHHGEISVDKNVRRSYDVLETAWDRWNTSFVIPLKQGGGRSGSFDNSKPADAGPHG